LNANQYKPALPEKPLKRWLARVGKERIDEIENPELAMHRMKEIYQKKGYPKDWIDKRMRGIAVRKSLTDEWNNRGAQTDLEYAILANEINSQSDAIADLLYGITARHVGLSRRRLRQAFVERRECNGGYCTRLAHVKRSLTSSYSVTRIQRAW